LSADVLSLVARHSFKLAAKEALMDGMRADLVAAKRQVALAEKEAETAQRQLQQREAEIASTHRSLLKLDDVKASSAAQAIHIDNLKSQLRAAQESGEALRADAARLKKALAAREAAARTSSHAVAPGGDAAHHGGDVDAMTLAQARDVLSKMGELTYAKQPNAHSAYALRCLRCTCGSS
jgi:hypothetical protein